MNAKNVLCRLCIILCAVLIVCGIGVLSPVAYAEGELQVNDLTVSPSSLPASGGNVTLSGTLENTIDEDITAVTLTVGSFQLDISEPIAAHSTRAFTMEDVPIASSEVGIQLQLSVDWTTGSTSGTETVNFTVPEEEQTVSLGFSRTVNNKTVQAGDSVTLTYNLKNNGTATITGLTLTDPCVSGTILSGVTLNPGETRQQTATITVSEGTTSVPKAVYTANSVDRTKTLESLTISIENADLSITATADTTEINAGETVVFTITIQNDSPVAVSDIKVTDDLGEIIRSSSSIPATTGSTPKTLPIEYETKMTTGRAVSFTVTYPSGTGTATKTSDPILINVNGLLPGVSPLELDVSASPVAMSSFPGQVTFSVTVQNTSGQTISGINVTETSLGNVGSIVTLAPGEQQTFTKEATLQAAGAFHFTATGTDTAGTDIEPATTEVYVTSAVGTPTPKTVEPSDTDTLSTLFIVMIVIVVLIVLAGVTLIILVIQEKRSKGNGPRGPRGGGSSRTRRRRDADVDADEDNLLFDDRETTRKRRLEDTGVRRRISDMEQTQPILRSDPTSSSTGRPLNAPGRRRTYTLRTGEDSILPRHDEGVIEEKDTVFGPVEYAQKNDGKSQLHRAPLNKASQTGEEDLSGRSRRVRRTDQNDALNDEDMDDRLRRKRPTLQEEEPSQRRPRYENEDDDDLPPLRPRRRR